MANFKRHTRPKQTTSGVDGFVRRQSSQPSSRNTSLSSKDRIDNFTKSEGFNPRKRGSDSQTPDGTQLGRKPIYKKDLDLQLPGQSSKSNQSKHKKKTGGRKKIKRAAMSMVAILILVGGYSVGMSFLQIRSVFEGGSASNGKMCEDIQPEELTEEDQCRINMLVLGVDDAADLTDSMMIASIDPIDDSAKLISIPRDLYVRAANGTESKINAVYSLERQAAINRGEDPDEAHRTGMKVLEETVEDIFDIEIDYYTTVNFEAFRSAVDIVDGVTIDVPEPLYDRTMAWKNDGDPLLAPEGEQTFDGDQALMYARSRFGSARGDFDRSERQRALMLALRNEVVSAGTFGNPSRITRLMDTFGDNVRTNLSINEVLKLYDIANRVDDSRIESIGLADPPNEYLTTGTFGGESVVTPIAGMHQYGEIQEYISSIFIDGFVKREDPKIVLLNGSSRVGLASSHKEKLESLGYNVIEATDAPTQDYEQTKFINISEDGKPYTERYIEMRYNTSSSDSLPSGINYDEADFVIILGRNEAFNN